MASRRERMEIALNGGRPWGFSIKGGSENNKPLVISKLEKGGKAECGGLFIGDVIYSINSVSLSGLRSEAIALVKQSGHMLVLEIERGVRPDTGGAHYRYPQGHTRYKQKAYYDPTLPLDQDPYNEVNYQRTRSQSDECELIPDREDVFRESPQSRLRSATTSSLASVRNSREALPQDGADKNDDFQRDAHHTAKPDQYQPYRSTERLSQAVSETPAQPPVRLREKKARDKGIPIERPRSWHASKYPDTDIEASNLYGDRRNMRSPGGLYPGSPASQARYHHHQQLLQGKQRRSKGWTDSGDLKSAYHGDVNGSKDSLISGGSQHSYRSNRLSVSSSRSSGTMSSSRGSLDNLADSSTPYRTGPDGYSQIYMSNSNKQKLASPSKPFAGIVNQNKHIFERLSHEPGSGATGDNHRQYTRGSREDLEKISRVRRTPSDDADRPPGRENSRSPPYQIVPNSDRSSLSPPLAKPGSSNRTQEGNGGDSHHYKLSSANIVKSNLEGRRHDPRVPDPPLRDSSSVQAVKNYHTRSSSGNSQDEFHRYSTSPDRVVSKLTISAPALPSSRHKNDQPSQEPASSRSSFGKSGESATARSGTRQERVFGVMSVGNSTNVVATSVTVSPKPNDLDRVGSSDLRQKPSSSSPARYERLKDAYSHYEVSAALDADPVHRKAPEHSRASHSEPTATPDLGSRSSGGSGDSSDLSEASRARGKSVVVWKTPQVHRKSKSTDFSEVLNTWAARDPTPAGEPGVASANTADEFGGTKADAIASFKAADRAEDDQPSIMRSLQSDRSLTEKVANTNYELLWISSSEKPPASKSGPDARSPTSVTTAAASSQPTANSTPKSGWENDFPSVDLDQHEDDDAFVVHDKYADSIKNMSGQVLRATSFTRKDLDVSPSIQSFDQKRSFFSSSKLTQSQARPAIIHGRSRSHGNEIEDEAQTKTGHRQPMFGSHAPLSGAHIKSRPKSAGLSGSRPNRHAPVQRATVAPSPYNSSLYYSRKSESLPRGLIPSYHSDESDHTSPTSKKAALAQNRRVSIDVKPDHNAPSSDSKVQQMVIGFMQNKAARESSSGSLHQTYTSSTSIHTSHSDETDKRRKKDENTPNSDNRMTKQSSFGDLTTPTKSEHSATQSRNVHGASVRKLKNFSATKAVFEIKLSSPNLNDHRRFPRGRTSSLENLADENAQEQKTRSPADGAEQERDRSELSPGGGRDRSKSSPITPPQSPSNTGNVRKDAAVQPPPRLRHSRQRLSNSSTTSSTTTISTMSSFSSSSTASAERFPTVDEASEPIAEENQPSPLRSNDTPAPPPSSTSQVPDAEDSKVEATEVTRKRHALFDSGTYRVVRGQKSHVKLPVVKSPPDGGKEPASETKQRATFEMRVNASPLISKTSIDQDQTRAAPKMDDPSFKIPPEPKPIPNEDRVAAIIEKVKRSSSFKNKVAQMPKSLPAPPPPADPLGSEAQEALKRMQSQQKFSDLPLPPPPPPPPQIPEKTSAAPSALSPMSKKLCANNSTTAAAPVSLIFAEKDASDVQETPETPTTDDTYKEVTYILSSSSDSEQESKPNGSADTKASGAPAYENVHPIGASRPYENVFKPLQSAQDDRGKTGTEEVVATGARVSPSVDENKENVNQRKVKETTFPAEPETKETSEPEKKKTTIPHPEISPKPLLPDVSFFPANSLQQEHPDLTRDIIKGDQTLAPMLTTSSKPTLHYMTDVMEQSSHEIVHQRMRSSVRMKPSAFSPASLAMNDICHENLPASSTYYKTSASKAKILNLVKEKIADGEIVPGEEFEDINTKKMELVLSIKKKLDDLQSLQKFLDDEIRDNEVLGKQVLDLTKQFSTPREQDKYNLFVQDVDRIINLLLSLSGRLARVENTIQMLPVDADKQEMELLLEKKNKLMEQHDEAKLLKENIDRRQKAVSETLAGYLNQAQFADYEHYIKMKSALIMEQRELLDKIKLGEEQMQCLRDSLPDEWQGKLDKMLEEDNA